MKLLFLTVAVLLAAGSRAQDRVVYHGSPVTAGASVEVVDGKRYEVTAGHGKLQEEVADGGVPYTLVYDIGLDEEGFKVTSSAAGGSSDSITLLFTPGILGIDNVDVYIGYRDSGADEYHYVNLAYETLLFNTKEDESYSPVDSFRIPRARHIQVGLRSRRHTKQGRVYADEFAIPEGAGKLFIQYNYISDRDETSPYLLAALVDTAGLVQVNERVFATDTEPSSYVARTASDTLNPFLIAAAAERKAFEKFDDPTLTYRPEATERTWPRQDTVAEFGSLQDAINAVQREDSTILLVFNSLLDNNATKHFRDISDDVHRRAGGSYGSEELMGRFLLYLVRPSDLELLEEYVAADRQSVIALSSSLDLLFAEAISMREYDRKYRRLSDELAEKIVAAGVLLRFKQKLTAGKLTAEDFHELGSVRDYETPDGVLFSAGARNAIFKAPVLIPEKKNNGGALPPPPPPSVQLADSQLRPERIRAALAKLIAEHERDKVMDTSYAKLALEVIDGYYFNRVADLSTVRDPSPEYHDLSRYLLRFDPPTASIQTEYTENVDHYGWSIFSLLKKHYRPKAFNEAEAQIFEGLMAMDEFRLYVIPEYFPYLIKFDRPPFEAFDSFIGEIVTSPRDLATQFDDYAKATVSSRPHIVEFKNFVIRTGNSLAWRAANDHRQDLKLLKKASVWCELALALDPEYHYVYDTYAHVEYYLGERDRAIQLEERAIELARASEVKRVAKYKATLQKIRDSSL